MVPRSKHNVAKNPKEVDTYWTDMLRLWLSANGLETYMYTSAMFTKLLREIIVDKKSKIRCSSETTAREGFGLEHAPEIERVVRVSKVTVRGMDDMRGRALWCSK